MTSIRNSPLAESIPFAGTDLGCGRIGTDEQPSSVAQHPEPTRITFPFTLIPPCRCKGYYRDPQFQRVPRGVGLRPDGAACSLPGARRPRSLALRRHPARISQRFARASQRPVLSPSDSQSDPPSSPLWIWSIPWSFLRLSACVMKIAVVAFV